MELYYIWIILAGVSVLLSLIGIAIRCYCMKKAIENQDERRRNPNVVIPADGRVPPPPPGLQNVQPGAVHPMQQGQYNVQYSSPHSYGQPQYGAPPPYPGPEKA